MKIVVTGATGYVATRLVTLSTSHGHVIVAASRRPSINRAHSWIPFDITANNIIDFPSGIDAVVHLAANTVPLAHVDEVCEVVAAKKLIISTQEAGAKFIFISSQTARSDAPTAYGRIKWRIEQEVLSAGGWVVRPGQVYGGELRGLFGMLVKTVRKLPVLPAFVPAPRVQPIHVDDLAEGLLRIIERADLPSGVYCLAAPNPVSFSKFIGDIAKSRLRCWRGFVPIPVVAINIAAFPLGEALRTRLGLERLRSLFDLPVMATSDDLKRLGLTLRPLNSGMHPSGNDRRRGLLLEGRALLAYVLREPAGVALLRRYVRAIESLHGGRELGLPIIFHKHPLLLTLLDGAAWSDKTTVEDFIWRLDAATVLAEATPLGAYRFLGLGRAQGVLSSVLALILAVVYEVLWRVARFLASPLVRLAMSRVRGAL